LPESCPRNGDLPKSPFPHWQQRCHRLAQSYLTVDACVADSGRSTMMLDW